MKPKEFGNLFSEYLEEGSTPKGTKVKSFFSHLSSSQKRLVANNIAKAYEAYLEEEKKRSEVMKAKKKEIAELKKKAKELGLVLSEA